MAGSFPSAILTWLGFARYNAQLPVATPGNTSELQCDQNGRLLVASQGIQPANYATTVTLENSHVVKNSPGTLLSFWGFNDDTTTKYLMFFNATSVPGNGTPPLQRFRVATGSIGFNDAPIAFAAGIVWAMSTTPNTLTIDAANKTYLSVTYL